MGHALIAGGSKGIGFAIAEALAKRGFDLILVARHIDKLTEAKTFLESRYKVNVSIFPKDLSDASAAEEVRDFCVRNAHEVTMLCNVAGFGGAKDYLSIPIEESRYMINLNIGSATSLTYQMLPILEKSRQSWILNVGSMAGFAPIPVKNIYSATKSAVIFFSRSLRSQLRKKNISVSCLCPGPVFTKPEIEKDTIEKMGWFGKQLAVDPVIVGEIAVQKTLQKKFLIIPGMMPKLVSFFVKVLPDSLLVWIYSKMVEKSE